jgi:hypothetical protein
VTSLFFSAKKARIFPVSAESVLRYLNFPRVAGLPRTMKNPGFTVRLIRLLFVGWTAVALTAMAEPPDNGKKAAARTRPQIIYHLPPASNYAATLHSQAKTQNNELPVDSSMPTSLQSANSNANAAQQQATPRPTAPERRVQPKMKANRPQASPRSFARPPGHGNPHGGGKSHKK